MLENIVMMLDVVGRMLLFMIQDLTLIYVYVISVQISKQHPESFPCPRCGANKLPAKFAGHLEKCMGMGGRESRRVAATKIKNQANGEVSRFIFLLRLCFQNILLGIL